VLQIHLITQGKTEAVHPHPAIQAEHSTVMCSHSNNHWSNHDLQCKWMKKGWDLKVAEYVKDGLELVLAQAATYIYFLDCWPVNLTKEFRQWVRDNCPGIILLFVPANATGRYQVNDTHCHGPMKAFYRAVAYAWYTRKVMRYRQQVLTGDLLQTEYLAKMQGLMSMPLLRNQCLRWLALAAKSLSLKDARE